MRELLKSPSSRLTDDLTTHLRKRILGGEFAVGAKITESRLASEYGVARPTARGAIDALVVDGLLERHAHSPARVREIRPDEIPEILAVLEFIESRALAEAARETPDLRTVKAVATSGPVEFLAAVVAACSSARMSTIHRSCSNELLLSMTRAFASDAEEGPPDDAAGRLLGALFKGDGRAAREAMQQVQGLRRTHTSSIRSF